MTLQISTGLRSFSPEDPGNWDGLLETARDLDEAGFDRISVSDHVVYGENLEAYGDPKLGGQEGGSQPTGPDGHWLEPLTTLAVVAGVTKRMRLSTGILLAALRRPVVLAKSAATLDVLSHGRLDLGVGVGWQEAEYEAAGLDFRNRGRLLDVALETCQLFWTERVAVLDLPELKFGPTHMMPKPTKPTGVPIWVSGTINDRVVNRLARFGSGWIPWGPDAKDLSESIPRMKKALEGVTGHPEDQLQVVGQMPNVRADDGSIDLARTMEQVPALARAGVTDVRVNLPKADMAKDRLRAVVEAFREAADTV